MGQWARKCQWLVSWRGQQCPAGLCGQEQGSDQPSPVAAPHTTPGIPGGFAPTPRDETQPQRGVGSAKVEGWEGELQHSPREVVLGLRGFPLQKEEGFGGGSDSSFW